MTWTKTQNSHFDTCVSWFVQTNWVPNQNPFLQDNKNKIFFSADVFKELNQIQVQAVTIVYTSIILNYTQKFYLISVTCNISVWILWYRKDFLYKKNTDVLLQSKNIESIFMTFPPKMNHLSFPHRHLKMNRQLGDILSCSWFPPSAALRLERWPRRESSSETEPIWRALAQHLQPSCVFLDDNQTLLLLLFFRWISRKWLLVGYFCVPNESGLLWCLLDASWCNMKNKEKSSFFVVNIIYSPVAALALPFHHVTQQRLKVHARCSATHVGFHIPDLQLWLWRLKEKSDSELLRSCWTFQNTSYSLEMMV